MSGQTADLQSGSGDHSKPSDPSEVGTVGGTLWKAGAATEVRCLERARLTGSSDKAFWEQRAWSLVEEVTLDRVRKNRHLRDTIRRLTTRKLQLEVLADVMGRVYDDLPQFVEPKTNVDARLMWVFFVAALDFAEQGDERMLKAFRRGPRRRKGDRQGGDVTADRSV